MSITGNFDSLVKHSAIIQSKMLAKVQHTLLNECSLKVDLPLIIGVSGGPDSLSLLHIMNELGYLLIVVHLNHGLRPEAEMDAKFVGQEAESLGLLFISSFEDTKAFAQNRGIAIEEAARHLRYRFLFAEADKRNAQAVVVGHTADDQVETVLMHLLRGAGLSGLRGMQVLSVNPGWHEDIPLIRPLLDVWREEIIEYCTQYDLQPLFDRSNLDTTLFRNRLRYELLPELEKYNPRVSKLIWQTANTLSADFEMVEQVINTAWDECVMGTGNGYIVLNRDAFICQPKGVQRGLARQAIAMMRPGLRDIDYASIERALVFIDQPTKTRKSDLIAGLCIRTEGDRFWIADWSAEVKSEAWPRLKIEELTLDLPGKTHLGGSWYLTSEFLTVNEETHNQALNNDDPFIGWFDAGKFGPEVSIRTRRTGDRFQPLGLRGHSTKLADFFINVKIPKRARKEWPLICDGTKVAWVPGYRLGHTFRVTEKTKKILKLYLHKEPDND